MVVADSRQFPWIAEEFAAVMEPLTERLVRYLVHLTAMGILDCRNPLLAAHQFMGMLNELSLWPWMTGRESSIAIPAEEVIDETIRIFLQHYRRPRSKRHGLKAQDNSVVSSHGSAGRKADSRHLRASTRPRRSKS